MHIDELKEMKNKHEYVQNVKDKQSQDVRNNYNRIMDQQSNKSLLKSPEIDPNKSLLNKITSNLTSTGNKGDVSHSLEENVIHESVKNTKFKNTNSSYDFNINLKDNNSQSVNVDFNENINDKTNFYNFNKTGQSQTSTADRFNNLNINLNDTKTFSPSMVFESTMTSERLNQFKQHLKMNRQKIENDPHSYKSRFNNLIGRLTMK